MTDIAKIIDRVRELSLGFARSRPERQQRRALDPADFDALRAAGLHRVGVPVEHGGAWVSVPRTVRPACELLGALARGDSSVALVSSMHVAVLSYWLSTPQVAPPHAEAWEAQRRAVFASAREGALWGTITSEPGSGGDVALTRAVARRDGEGWALSGQKHFGSGSGVMSYFITTAIPEGEAEPDWFYMDLRGASWDGSRGVRLLAEWDGHGMAATQSHAMAFADVPALRVAWPGHRKDISDAAGPFIGCLFTAVIAGVVDAAIDAARAQLAGRALRPFEQVEWTRAEVEAWTAAQALDGMVRAVERGAGSRDVALGKLAVSELAESCLSRLCRVLGGGTYGRRSPFGHWFEDVRALGFLRPPWGFAFDGLFATAFAG